MMKRISLPLKKTSEPAAIDLCHSVAMLSLRRIKKFCFCTASLAQARIQCEASRAKRQLFILLRLDMAARDNGLLPEYACTHN